MWLTKWLCRTRGRLTAMLDTAISATSPSCLSGCPSSCFHALWLPVQHVFPEVAIFTGKRNFVFSDSICQYLYSCLHVHPSTKKINKIQGIDKMHSCGTNTSCCQPRSCWRQAQARMFPWPLQQSWMRSLQSDLLPAKSTWCVPCFKWILM
jgi:hypothetical protein